MWYLYDSGYACGGILTDENGIIILTAPIFYKLKGRNIATLYGRLYSLETEQ